MDKKLEILHVAEEAGRLDHFQPLLRRRFSRHINQIPHKVSHIIRLAHLHTAMTQYTTFLCKGFAWAGGSTVVFASAAWIISIYGRIGF